MSKTRDITPGFAKHDLHALASFPLPQLLNAFCDLPWRVDTQQLLVPLSGICLAVDVLPVSQFSRGGGVDLFVDLGATIVFDPVLDGGNGDDKYEGECRSLRRGSAKHGKN